MFSCSAARHGPLPRCRTATPPRDIARPPLSPAASPPLFFTFAAITDCLMPPNAAVPPSRDFALLFIYYYAARKIFAAVAAILPPLRLDAIDGCYCMPAEIRQPPAERLRQHAAKECQPADSDSRSPAPAATPLIAAASHFGRGCRHSQPPSFHTLLFSQDSCRRPQSACSHFSAFSHTPGQCRFRRPIAAFYVFSRQAFFIISSIAFAPSG